MLKGIRGLTNADVHLLPVIDNTPRESQLVANVERMLADPRFDALLRGARRATTAATCGAPTSGRRSATPRSTTILFEAIVARLERGYRPPVVQSGPQQEEERP